MSEHIYFCYNQVWSFPIIDGRYSTTSTYETRIRDERSFVAMAARQETIPVSKDLSSFAAAAAAAVVDLCLPVCLHLKLLRVCQV